MLGTNESRPPQTLTNDDNGASPLFRSFPPATHRSRMFPQLSDVLSGSPTPGEKLPTTNRVLNFRVTVRDAMSPGVFVQADTRVHVVDTGSPFRLTSHNEAGIIRGPQTITWNLAGTATAPINASNVTLRLSTNGGVTFPILLASNVVNDGFEIVTLPSIECANARIKIEAVGNIFLDINDADLAVSPLRITAARSNGELTMKWTGAVGRNYGLESSPDAVGPWTDFPMEPIVTGNEWEVRTPLESTGDRFFRLTEF